MLADAIEGARRPSQTITWADDAGTPLDLTGAVITARIRNRSSSTVAASTGTFAITDAANGVFRWDYSADDVATAGRYEVQFTATFGTAPTTARTITANWRVLEAI